MEELDSSTEQRDEGVSWPGGHPPGGLPHDKCGNLVAGKISGIGLQPAADFSPPAAGFTSFAGGRAEAWLKPAADCPNSPSKDLDRKSTRLNSSHLGISYA